MIATGTWFMQKAFPFPPLIQQLLLPSGDPTFIYRRSSGEHCSSVYSDAFLIQGNGQCSMLYSAAETNWKEQALPFPQGEKVGAYGGNMLLL